MTATRSRQPLLQQLLEERALDRAAGSRPIPGNRITFLPDSPAAYEVMLQMIGQAEHRICLENYIFRSDEVGWRFADAIAARHRDGVEVRLLCDWFGSIATSRRLWQHLAAAGVEVRLFQPPAWVTLVDNLSRNHRKLLVVDGSSGVVGGQCIGSEWSGDPARGIPPWRDTALAIAGPAAVALEQAFGLTWQRAGGLFPGEGQVEVPEQGDVAVRVVAGVPGAGRAYRVTQLLAAGTMERLWITDAYLLAAPGLYHAMLDAAREGVDVRLLVPGSSDVPLVRNLTRFGYRDLLRAGVRIFEWNGPMLHAKTLVADGRWVRVGSTNMNQSSFVANYELDLLIDNIDLARELEASFRRDLSQSAEITRRPVRVPARIARALPAALERRPPEISQVTRRRMSGLERRRRAARTLSILLASSRQAVFGPLLVGLVALGLAFIILPRPMSILLGLICLWLGVGAGAELWRRRAAP